METNNTTDLINQLSDEFSRLIVANFTAEQLAETIAKNRTREYAGCCATHDYCDSNMVMNEAFENVMNREFIFWDDDKPETHDQHRYDMELFNCAWAISKSKDFAVDADPGAFAQSEGIEFRNSQLATDFEAKDRFSADEHLLYDLEKDLDPSHGKNWILTIYRDLLEGFNGQELEEIEYYYYNREEDAEHDANMLEFYGKANFDKL